MLWPVQSETAPYALRACTNTGSESACNMNIANPSSCRTVSRVVQSAPITAPYNAYITASRGGTGATISAIGPRANSAARIAYPVRRFARESGVCGAK